jgi:Tripartite tricarboxylate transporter TctB family
VNLRVRIHSRNDVAAGALFAAIGIATIALAAEYPLGTMRSIGPGYFPILIGGVLALLGAAIGFQGLAFGSTADAPATQSLKRAEDDHHGIAVRPLIMITLAVVVFGVTVRPLGLAIATIVLVALSSLAGPEFGLRRVILLSAGLIVLSWATFIYLLGLPMTLWPR